jgi:DNA polymerase-2
MSVGFILHPTWYLEHGRPVVHLFGKLASGETFVVRDGRPRPHFFVLARELPAALGIVPMHASECPWTAPDGEPLGRVTLNDPSEAASLQARLEAHGFATFEADLSFVTRYLVDAGIRGSMRIKGPWQSGRRVGRIYQDPELSPETWVPALSVLSLDIETTPDLQQVLSVALWGASTREVIVLRPRAAETGGGVPIAAPDVVATAPGSSVAVVEDERDLLLLLDERVRTLDPDILTGWNVIDFDLRVLQQRFEALRVPFHLGRADLPCRLFLDRGGWGNSRAVVPGRVVLDGLALLRAAQERLDDWRLETAARAVLGEGKAVSSADLVSEIGRLYREDLPAFLSYNLADARLVHEILDRRRLVDLTVRQSLLTGLPLDRTGASIAAFDSLYLTELHRRRTAAPSVAADRPLAPTAGGFVLPARPGIHEWVAVLDYRSLYPSIIRTFRIDPLSRVRDAASSHTGNPVTQAARVEVAGAAAGGSAGDGTGTTGDEAAFVTAPNGERFRLEGGILPEILDRLLPERERLREEGDRVGATAVKLLMNSFYGVLATPRCRFYSPETANAITGFGQQILHWTRESIEAGGRRVLYGDTDSIFVALRADDPAGAHSEARDLAERTTIALTDHLRETHGVKSRCELRADRVFRRLILFPLRAGRRTEGAPEGSRKRYAGLVDEAEGPRVVYVGLEQVRRDWTALAKLFQRELVERVFRGDPVDAFVRDFLLRFRAGEFDDLLAYRRTTRGVGHPAAFAASAGAGGTRPAGEAAETRPTMARKGRVEHLVMTIAGPEPESERRHTVDRAHYEEKQLRPVGESVLGLLGLDWEGVTGGQGSLF